MKISKITEKQSCMDPFGEVRQKDQWYWERINTLENCFEANRKIQLLSDLKLKK
tara:strand:- start:7884 stop:8045 length:162 start_codon:yes stop_codon:yes gene_type:complete